MVYQPEPRYQRAAVGSLKKGLIFNAIEEEATTTTEVVLAAEVGSMTTTTDAMIVVGEEILEAEAEAAMAVVFQLRRIWTHIERLPTTETKRLGRR